MGITYLLTIFIFILSAVAISNPLELEAEAEAPQPRSADGSESRLGSRPRHLVTPSFLRFPSPCLHARSCYGCET
ncbi:hypothetical protein BGW80DRAFT_1276664 [Lactifluus volemus]|nr:hypothetical protein BGW80DRAFT_1276664 [Lactifluus volemus]